MASFDDDLPPPLEDMSEELERLRVTNTPAAAFPLAPPRKAEEPPSKGEKTHKDLAKKKKKKSGGEGMFGGMQGGFFGGGAAKVKKKKKKKKKKQQQQQKLDAASEKKDDDILRPNQEAAEESLRFDEVRQAVFGQYESQEKLTGELVGELTKDERLMERMKDPRIARAVAEISADGAAGAKKYANDKEVMEVFSDFMALAARRAEKKAAEEERAAQRPRQVPQEQMQRWLADPALRAVLNDPWTGQALSEIQKDSNAFARFSGDRRLQALVRAGILEVPPQFCL